MKIYFVTSNKGKLKEFQEKLKNIDIVIEHIKIPYIEIQSDSLEEIAKFGAEFLADKIKKEVIVEDSGLFIDKLKGFPGPYSKHAFLTIGCRGIIKLLEDLDRKAHFESVIGYCKPNEKAVAIKGICNGKIAKEERGNRGFGFDPIFIPDGAKLTFAEMTTKEKNLFSHRGKSIEGFIKFLELKNKIE